MTEECEASTLILGLTGGVGSGKSAAESIFRSMNIPTADADRWAHDILSHDADVKQRLGEYFNQQFQMNPFLSEGEIDRALIARTVFKDRRSLVFLEALIHPRVRALAEDWIAEQRSREVPLAVLIVPLLLESGMQEQCDLTVAIAASADIRTERLWQSRGWSAEESQERMDRQLDDPARCARADYVIINEGTLGELEQKLRALLQKVGSRTTRGNRNIKQ